MELFVVISHNVILRDGVKHRWFVNGGNLVVEQSSSVQFRQDPHYPARSVDIFDME